MRKKKNINTLIKDAKKIVQVEKVEPITSLGLMHLLWIVVLVGLLNLFFFPANKMSVSHIEYVTNEPISRDSMRCKIKKVKPKVVLIGNSMLGRGVHEQYFNDLTKIPALIFAPGGAESAWCYLVFKNIICKSKIHIPNVAIFFTDNELTDPSYRVTDGFKPALDELCEKNEPLLDRLAYFNNMSDVEFMVSSYWPLYQKRKAFKTEIDSAIKENMASIFFNAHINDMENAKKRVFADTNMNKEMFSQYQFKIEKNKSEKILFNYAYEFRDQVYISSDFDFKNKVNTSFLPEIISLAKQNNIKLIFVRVKKRRDVIPNRQSPELIAYIKDLSEYFSKQNIVFIDYTNDRRIKEENYSDGDHQDNRNAPMTFTELVADTLPQFY